MYINGSWVQASGNRTFDMFNPANGDKIAAVPDGGQEGIADYLKTKLVGFAV